MKKIVFATLIATLLATSAMAQTVPPDLAPIGPQLGDESQTLTINVSATDGDATTPVLSVSTVLPANASFVDNGDGTGVLTFNPDFSQANVYNMTFLASDPVTSDIDSEQVVVTINNVNVAPVLAAIGPQNGNENQLLTFNVSATDFDGGIATFSASSLPAGASFVDNGDNTGTFSWTPTFLQANNYSIVIRATDVSLAVDSEIVNIAINNVNADPVLATIGPKNVNENQLLTFNVNASDIDGGIAAFTTSALPAGASFVDNGDNTGTFSWTPTFSQANVYNITFRATDVSSAVDSEVVVITVNNVNVVPVLATIGPKNVNENQLLTFNVSASDVDGGIAAFTTSALPAGASFVDNGDNTGTFSWTPTFSQANVYNITFRATDASSAVDSEVVVITVNNVNVDPVLATIGAKNVNENQLLTFNVSASDIDGGIAAFTTSALPAGASFIDNGDNTGTFSWTPTFSQANVYNITFRATDVSSAVDSEVVVITVNNVNVDPVLATIGPKNVNENQLLTFNVSASDVDGGIAAFTTSALPAGASFVDNGDNTGTFSWTPGFTQANVYNVTFRAADVSSAVDSEIVVITVNNVNADPVLATIGPKNVNENQLLTFNVSASDIDGGIAAFTTSSLPAGASFVDNGDNTGTFSWTPTFAQANVYNVTFRATDVALAIDSEVVTITVTENNAPPVLASIGAKNVNENQLLTFNVSASDIDGGIAAFTTTALPAGASFVDNGDNTGTFSWTPSFTQANVYNVTFRATDVATAVDSEVVVITVNNVNADPVLATIGPKGVNENQLLTFNVSASDIDGGIAAFTTSALPSGASFVDNGDNTGTFSWTPTFAQANIYNVTFRATDVSSAVDSEVVTITVTENNAAPVLAAIGPQNGNENQLLTFNVSASDVDGGIATFSTSTLPSGASFVDNGDNTGTFSWTPSFSQANVYNITFRATDIVSAVDSEIVTITVSNTNQPPVLAAIGAKSVDELANLNFNVSSSDPDVESLTLTTSTLPTGATFVDNGDNTGTFDWTPDGTQSGSYQIVFRATDAGTAVDSEIVTITVNEPPVLDPIGAQNPTEGGALNFGINASDLDGTPPVLTTSTLPSGASFIDNGDGTGTFSWTPTFIQAGIYNITFYATDVSGSIDSELVVITVQEAGNQAPVVAPRADTTVAEGSSLAFTITASDPDGTIPTLDANGVPPNATFVDNGNGTGSFTFNPDLTQQGNYDVTFRATDGSLLDSIIVNIVVTGLNQSPVLTTIGPRNTNETVLLTFGVSATDADGGLLTLTTSPRPAGASFVDNTNGTGTFSWTPTGSQSGVYPITFYVTDAASAIDSEIVIITVFDINQPPVLATIGNRTVLEGTTLAFNTTATDPNGTIPTFTAVNLPPNATYVDNNNGSGTFTFNPTLAQGGFGYTVLFIATDGSLSDSESVIIQVLNTGNLPPTLSAIDDTLVAEGDTLVINVTSADPDGGAFFPDLSIGSTLSHYTFVDHNDGTGTLTYRPNYFDAGIDTVRIFATDQGSPQFTATELFVITTVDVNQPPTWKTPVGPFNAMVNKQLIFKVQAFDSTGTSGSRLFLSLLNPPANTSFVDSGNGKGLFSFTPSAGQIGPMTVSFVAVDDDTPPSTSATLNVQITVRASNVPPVLANIGPKSVTEGQTLAFSVISTDPDGGGVFPTISAKNLPPNASLTPLGLGQAAFLFTPGFTQAGLYAVTFEANDGFAIDKEVVLIQVYEAGDQAPVFDSIPAPIITELDTLRQVVTATDPEGQAVTLSLVPGTLPPGATFTVNAPGRATIFFVPTFSQQGTYNVLIAATSGTKSDTITVVITVNDVGNQLPVLATIGPKSSGELRTLAFGVSAVDVDGPPPIMTAAPLPAGATFTDNNSGGGNFSWSPSDVQAGTYNVTFYAEDRAFPGAFDSEQVVIQIADTNRLPFIFTSGSRLINEGDTLRYLVQAVDLDGTIPLMRAKLDGTDSLATNMVMFDSLNGKGVLTFIPGPTQGGTVLSPKFYFVRFYARDGADTTLIQNATSNVQIEVRDKNFPPVLSTPDGPGPFNKNEGDSVVFRISTTDVDGALPPTLVAQNMPAGAVFDIFLTLGTFRWKPNFTQAGSYNVRFVTVDDKGAADTQIVAINIADAGNQAPVFQTILPDTINCLAGTQNSITVKATDPDLGLLTLTATPVLVGAGFVDSGNGAGTYFYQPDLPDIGSVNQVRFVVTDPLLAADTVITHLRVVSLLRGDLDNNTKYTVSDLAMLISYLFRQGPPPSPIEVADVNGEGAVNISDITYLINFIYFNGPQPPK